MGLRESYTQCTMRMVDLSHIIEEGMITYPGLPGPAITDHLTRADSSAIYAEGTTFQIGRLSMVANTGTYVDSPWHRFESGKDIAALPLESLADLEGVVINTRRSSSRSIGADFFSDLDLQGKAVLIHTGWSRHWGTRQYFEGHPFLGELAVEVLARSGAAIVGIDSLNIDDMAAMHRPAHSSLLEKEIPIVEHMANLHLLSGPFRFFAVPAPVRGLGTFPVRAFAILGISAVLPVNRAT
ncbi:MAG: cyclase family protein [Acidobacteriota bacterium]